jgi:hypothetical protein
MAWAGLEPAINAGVEPTLQLSPSADRPQSRNIRERVRHPRRQAVPPDLPRWWPRLRCNLGLHTRLPA